MWKLTYDAPRGLRVNRYFWSITTFGSGLWWCYESEKWVTDTSNSRKGVSTHCHGPKTTKAFLRYLKKHPELKGEDVVFVNNRAYDDCELNITARWEE